MGDEDRPALLTRAMLEAEVARLKRGDWTPEEAHDICHNLHGKVGAPEFAAGCAAEQRKLYGCAPDADQAALLRDALQRIDRWDVLDPPRAAWLRQLIADSLAGKRTW